MITFPSSHLIYGYLSVLTEGFPLWKVIGAVVIFRFVGVPGYVLWSAVFFFGIIFVLYIAHFCGMLEFSPSVRQVRTSQVRLSMADNAKDVLREHQWQELRRAHGSDLEELVAFKKKIAAKGPGVSGRVSPMRAMPVLADVLRPDERFWALHNYHAMRATLYGYAEVRVKVLDPELVNPTLALDLSRWQALRAKVAGSPGKWRADLAKRLRAIEPVFNYPEIQDDCLLNKVELRFLGGGRSEPSKKVVAGKVNSMGRSIDELEAEFGPRLDEARRAHAALMEKSKEKKLRRELALQEAGCQSPSALSLDIDEEGKEEEGLCVACLDASATLVMRGCGHLVFCGTCRRRVVGVAKRTSNLKALTPRQLETTGVACPICRKTSYPVRQQDYKSIIFKQ